MGQHVCQLFYYIINLEFDMFKKPVKISAQNQLSGKDRKTMRNKLAEVFDEACVDKIFAVNDKIISCKISGSKMVIYNGNDYPIFVDQSGKNDYFPSLYTAMAYEPLIKTLDINEGVESYIYNGANLMWPGVRNFSALGKFQKGQPVAIRSAKGQLIAIGLTGCSFKDLQSNPDGNGVAVQILHFHNDKLWQSGPKGKPQVVVKAQKPVIKQQKKLIEEPKKQQKKAQGKQKVQVKGKKQEQPQEKKKQTEQKIEKKQQKGKEKEKQKNKKGKKQQSSQQEKKKKQQSAKESESDDEVDFGSLVHAKKGAAKQVKVEKKGPQKTFSDDQDNDKKAKKKPAKKQTKKKGGKKQSDHQDEQLGSEGEQKKQSKKQKGQMKQQEQKSAVSSKLMDQQFKQSFLNALKLSKVQGQLPIDSGRFFMDFMLLARPPGVKLQIKDTSYKKLGKFYEQMSKQKFIQFKHNKDKKGQQGSSIVKIMWQNDQLKNYQPTILKMNEKEQQEKEDVSDSKKKLKLTQNLEIQNVYKLHPNFKAAVFAKKVNYAPTEQQQKQMKKQQQQINNQPQFYPQHQARALIQKYINQKVVEKKNKKQDKQKKGQKADKTEKTDKMVAIDYKNNKYLAQLLKKQIEEYQQNAEGDKEADSGSQQEAKKGKKKKQSVMRIDRGALVNRIFRTCSASYHMKDKQSGIESFNEGTFKGIQLVAEKSNNKNITKIVGLETFIVPKSQVQQQIHGFANYLKQKFACSVNIQNLPGKNAGKQIIVHGNFINELEQMFTEEHKLNQDYITSQNKLDKKKKR